MSRKIATAGFFARLWSDAYEGIEIDRSEYLGEFAKR